MNIDKITKEYCDNIVKKDIGFYSKELEIDGTPIVIYNYRHTTMEVFEDNDAYELRGLTFVKTGDSWKRYLALDKFFNINQGKNWMLEDFKNDNIVEISDKLDGSMITFININGKMYPKTKMSFDSPQALLVKDILSKDSKLKDMLNTDIVYIFEIVSPKNQIVLQYDNTELILLQGRYPNGVYMTNHELERVSKKYNVTLREPKFPNITNITDLLDLVYTSDEDIEGVVVRFQSGKMAKIKSKKYLELHKLIGPDAFAENSLIKTIVDDNIDDVISQLNEGERRNDILKLKQIIDRAIISLNKELNDLFGEYKGDRKEFALKYSKNRLFGTCMNKLKTNKSTHSLINEYILKNTNKLTDAIKFINEWK